MFLNMTIIAEMLGNLCIRSSIKSSEKALTLSHVEIYEPDIDISENIVYIVETDKSDLNTFAGQNAHILCMGDSEISLLEDELCDVIYVAETTVPILLSAVQNVFQRYEQWDQRLKDVMLRRGTVTDLLTESRSVFPSDILVHDKDLKTIAYRTHADHVANNPLDTLRQNEILSKRCLATFVKSAKINSEHQDPFAVKGPHFWTSSTGLQCLNMNVFYNDTCIARIVLTPLIEADQPTKKDVGPLVLLCTYIRAILSTSFIYGLDNSEDAFSTLLKDLINGRAVSKTKLETIANARGWDYWNDEYIYLAVKSLSTEVERLGPTYPLISLFRRITEMFPGSHPLVIDNRGFVLLNLSKSRSKLESICGILNHIAIENNCRFGICRTFTGIRHLNRAHIEASTALDYATDQLCAELGRQPLRVSDVVLPLVDKCIGDQISPLSFCPEELLHLIHYDNIHKSELYNTIRAYIEANCSPTKCARALFIQRSTFQYRFEKATEILGMDLDDPNNQLCLRLSFRLLDMLSARDFKSI